MQTKGKHVEYHRRAEATAEYLEKQHWGAGDNEHTDFDNDKIAPQANSMQLDDITMQELRDIIKKFKRRKAPGPDNIPMEFYK